ncbi:MAG TPA: DUF3536 domain-containing protein [Anaerolineaceae bacterium]|nr:DUF3536 domain-containing protein [Anaerolineaceae bacterium]
MSPQPSNSPSFCVHGHFYQPVREDPLTNEIPEEQGAAPYHDWNERIYAHCYAPNAELGNFERISFNIGPTLFTWLDLHHPETSEMIVTQERRNVERYGVGNAMAQAYHHTILPLARREDKITEVMWGIADFENRFKHTPRGMWLPETAADLQTLEVLADCGIQFTILAPWQAAVDSVDITHPYWVELPNNKRIVVFFYQPELSARISFDPGSTANADDFYNHILLPQFYGAPTDSAPKFVMMASDGELYGHHQPFRDKFLSRLTQYSGDGPRPTFPALWLQQNQPTHTMAIREKTSWSCHHGVLRWSGQCGCTPHGEWKTHLRQALNRIAEVVDAQYLAVVKPLLSDPWQLRHQYIRVLLGQLTLADLVELLVGRRLTEHQIIQLDLLLSAQHERQRMFTSCGWFFEDFDRIEPRNVVAYAAQAVWLTNLATGEDFSQKALGWLRPVESWVSGLRADVVFSDRLALTRKFFDRMQPSVWVPG